MSFASNIELSLKKLIEKKSLSFEEAQFSMEDIMNGCVSPVVLSSWLTALKMKGENSDEISGCASALRRHVKSVHCDDSCAVDTCGTGGDSSGTFNISTASAFVAAGAGVTVAKHGNKAVSGKTGSADVLTDLGVNINITPELMEKCLNSIGMAFLFAPLLHPAMKHAMPVRKELGFGTIFNIIGPLSNPSNVKRSLTGVYEKRLCRLVSDALLMLGSEHAMVVHGEDGLDEITITAKTHICEIRDGKIKEYDFDPVEYGINLCGPGELKVSDHEKSAAVIEGILKGEITGARKNIVILNAAAAILVSGKSPFWKDAINKANHSIETGKALEKLNALRKFTNCQSVI